MPFIYRQYNYVIHPCYGQSRTGPTSTNCARQQDIRWILCRGTLEHQKWGMSHGIRGTFLPLPDTRTYFILFLGPMNSNTNDSIWFYYILYFVWDEWNTNDSMWFYYMLYVYVMLCCLAFLFWQCILQLPCHHKGICSHSIPDSLPLLLCSGTTYEFCVHFLVAWSCIVVAMQWNCACIYCFCCCAVEPLTNSVSTFLSCYHILYSLLPSSLVMYI